MLNVSSLPSFASCLFKTYMAFEVSQLWLQRSMIVPQEGSWGIPRAMMLTLSTPHLMPTWSAGEMHIR